MEYGSFSFMLTVVNELENQVIIRKSVDRPVDIVAGTLQTIHCHVTLASVTTGGAFVGLHYLLDRFIDSAEFPRRF